MKHLRFAKTAAILCSIVLLVMIGIVASVKLTPKTPKRNDIISGKTNIVAGIVTAKPGEKVEFPVYVVNNSRGGFSSMGMLLYHDERLIVSLDQNGKPVTKMGDAADDLTTYFAYKKDKCCVGLAMIGDKREKEDGIMFTVEITVPSDAKNGDKYPMTVDIDKLMNKDNQRIEHAAVDGYIIIQTD